MYRDKANNVGPKFVSILYFLLLVLMIADRIILLTLFGFRYTGSDDTVMWHGAINYMHGYFHEPFFYGQDYNYMTESIFASILMKAGMYPQYALPLITSFMTLFPFLTFSYCYFRKGNLAAAFTFLSIPLLLPLEFAILTSMSRGFVNGIFFLSFIPMLTINKTSRISFFLAGFLISLASVVNPNALIVAIPLLTYLSFKNYRNLNFYLFTISGIIIVLILHHIALNFYVIHPEYKIHGLGKDRMKFNFDLVKEAFSKLNFMFKYLSPVFWHYGMIAFFLLVILLFLLFVQKKTIPAFAALSSLLLIIFSFGFGKVHDGYDFVFLPVSRMFLALPLLYGILLAWLFTGHHKQNLSAFILTFLSIMFFIYKVAIAENKIAQIVTQKDYGPVAIIEVNELKQKCAELDSLAAKYKASLLVLFAKGDKVTSINFKTYGCSALQESFPPTLFPGSDRRIWQFYEEKSLIRKNILFFGGYAEFWDNTVNKGLKFKKISEHPFIYILTDNNMNTFELLEKMDLPTDKRI